MPEWKNYLKGVYDTKRASAAILVTGSARLETFRQSGDSLTENATEAGRWRRYYLDGLIREDILSFKNIRELRAMNLLVDLLRSRVASPLSYQSLSPLPRATAQAVFLRHRARRGRRRPAGKPRSRFSPKRALSAGRHRWHSPQAKLPAN